jgi:hypothetical protein
MIRNAQGEETPVNELSSSQASGEERNDNCVWETL